VEECRNRQLGALNQQTPLEIAGNDPKFSKSRDERHAV